MWGLISTNGECSSNTWSLNRIQTSKKLSFLKELCSKATNSSRTLSKTGLSVTSSVVSGKVARRSAHELSGWWVVYRCQYASPDKGRVVELRVRVVEGHDYMNAWHTHTIRLCAPFRLNASSRITTKIHAPKWGPPLIQIEYIFWRVLLRCCAAVAEWPRVWQCWHFDSKTIQRPADDCTKGRCHSERWDTLQHTAPHCNTLPTHCQHTANTLQHTNTDNGRNSRCHKECLDTLQHTATHCNTLNTLQHTATHWTHCSTLQHTATHCNTRTLTLILIIAEGNVVMTSAGFRGVFHLHVALGPVATYPHTTHIMSRMSIVCQCVSVTCLSHVCCLSMCLSRASLSPVSVICLLHVCCLSMCLCRMSITCLLSVDVSLSHVCLACL